MWIGGRGIWMIWVAISWGDVIISHSLFQKFYFINQIKEIIVYMYLTIEMHILEKIFFCNDITLTILVMSFFIFFCIFIIIFNWSNDEFLSISDAFSIQTTLSIPPLQSSSLLQFFYWFITFFLYWYQNFVK